MRICLIAADNPHYVHSLVQALASSGLRIDLIGDNRYKHFEFSSNVKFLNFRGSRNPRTFLIVKLSRVLKYYTRCLAYMWRTDTRLVHIQGFRFIFFEGLILVPLYRTLGKKIVYTAHNLQPKGKSDNLTYVIFYFIYRIVSHIICHTEKMKATVVAKYKVPEAKVTVVRHGINLSVPSLQIEQPAARKYLGIAPSARVLLIFGKIRRYKGVDIALQALRHLSQNSPQTVLLVAGGGDNNDKVYLKELKDYVYTANLVPRVKFHTDFIRDEDIELFFRAADILLLPHREGEFQSGVLFLAYRFGLPAIVSDVGSFAEDVEVGVSGFVFRSKDPISLAKRIEQFYQELYSNPRLGNSLQAYLSEKYQWDQLSHATMGAYECAQR